MSDMSRWQDLYADYSREFERGETDMTFEAWMIEQTIDARLERDQAHDLLSSALPVFQAVARQDVNMLTVRIAGELALKVEKVVHES
jgi:hypothetical protein